MAFTYRERGPGLLILRILKYQIEALQEYADLVSNGFAGVLTDLEREANKLPAARRADYFDWRYDSLVIARDDGPQILNGTVLVGLYTILERGLIDFCRIGQNRKQSSKELKKGGGESTIGAARRYLKKDLGFSISDGCEWDRLDTIRLIRNCLIHEMGKVAKPKKPLLLAIQNTPGVRQNDLGYLAVGSEAVTQFADDILAYCTRVAEAISS